MWRNETKGGNWLKVKLAGNAIGARVRAGSQWQEQTSTAGYTSSNLDVIHFGLGDADIVNEVEIHWPDGRKQLLKNVRAGQTIAVGDRARPD